MHAPLPHPVIYDSKEVEDLPRLLREANDKERHYRALWNAVEGGELGSRDINLIMEALTALAEHKRAISFEMEKQAREAGWLLDKSKGAELMAAVGRMNRAAANARDLRDKIDSGSAVYIMPEDI